MRVEDAGRVTLLHPLRYGIRAPEKEAASRHIRLNFIGPDLKCCTFGRVADVDDPLPGRELASSPPLLAISINGHDEEKSKSNA